LYIVEEVAIRGVPSIGSGEMTSTVYIYFEGAVGVALSDIVRCARIDGFVVRYARKD